MKVLHVISGISRDSGGPSRSSQGLVAAECRAGVDAWIYPFDGAEPWIEGVRKFRVKSLEFRVQSRGQELGVRGQGEDSLELGVEDLKGFDLVHIHGIWSPRLHNVAKMCRAAKVPYIIAPRGMLEPWSLKQKWLKKRIARFLYQDKDLKCAAALHATAESEAEQFRKLGFRNPVVISPNGVNVPGNFNRVERAERVDGERKRVLFVSRMHPKKGVLELVEAWGRVGVRVSAPCGCSQPIGTRASRATARPSQELGDRCLTHKKLNVLYLGRRHPLKGVEYLETAVRQLQNSTRSTRSTRLNIELRIVSDAKGEELEKVWEWCDVLVLPTLSENFGLVVAEALERGKRVITTDGAPAWEELGVRSQELVYLKGFRDGSDEERIKLLKDALMMMV